MTTANEALNGAPEATIDPFSIFNTPVEEIKSFEEPESKERKDWDSIFFEPDPKKGDKGVYQVMVKLLPNISNPKMPIVRKVTYKLPNPTNPKWNFTYDSPLSVGEKCIVANKFFESKDSTDPRIQAIGKNLKRKKVACCAIQIIKNKQEPELEGQVRLLRLGTDQTLDVMIKGKVAPTAEDLEMGKQAENVFDPFFSRYLIIKVTEDANGRNFEQSYWSEADMKGGMMLDLDGKPRIINNNDRQNKDVQVKIVELLQQPNVNINEHFAYKAPDEEKLKFVQRSLDFMFGQSVPGDAALAQNETADPAAGQPVQQPAAQPANAASSANAAASTSNGQPEQPAAESKPNSATQSDADFMKSLGLNS